MSKKAETDVQSMTIDQAIQEFAGYARGENGFDELDLKEVIANRVTERIKLVKMSCERLSLGRGNQTLKRW